jgi:hypothetical protein
VPLPDGAKEVHDTGGEAGIVRFEEEVLARRNGSHLLEGEAALAFVEGEAVNGIDEANFRVGELGVMEGLADDGIAAFEFKTFDEFTGNERIVGGGFAVAGGVEQLTGLIWKDFQETGYGNLFFFFNCIFWLAHSVNGVGCEIGIATRWCTLRCAEINFSRW